MDVSIMEVEKYLIAPIIIILIFMGYIIYKDLENRLHTARTRAGDIENQLHTAQMERDHLYKEKDRLHQEKDRLHQEKDHLHKEKDHLHKEKDHLHKEKFTISNDKNRLELILKDTNHVLTQLSYEHLIATKKLCARGVFETFQRLYVSPKRNMDRRQHTRISKWQDFMKSDDDKVTQLENELKNAGITDPVPVIAKQMYEMLSDGIHNFYQDGVSVVFLVKQELGDKYFPFMKTLCDMMQIKGKRLVIYETSEDWKANHTHHVIAGFHELISEEEVDEIN